MKQKKTQHERQGRCKISYNKKNTNTKKRDQRCTKIESWNEKNENILMVIHLKECQFLRESFSLNLVFTLLLSKDNRWNLSFYSVHSRFKKKVIYE